MKRIIVSVTNDLTTDQRVEKVCNTLVNNGFDLLLIGRQLPNSKKINRNYKTKRLKLLFKRGFLFYAEYNCRLFFKLLFLKKDILLANDLDTLLPNYVISKFFKIPLVFDSHELFSELPSVQHRFSKKVWKFIEKLLLPKIKHTITVSDSIANWYKKNYGIRASVIKNYPTLKNVPFTQQFEDYIIYQGALNKGRGLKVLLQAMKNISLVKLIIAGDGPIKRELEVFISKNNLSKKVTLLGNIPPTELIKITKRACLGVSLEEDLGLSYRYSLPNKLFDYIQAKIPVVVTNLPEIKSVVETYEVGEIITKHNPKNISQAILKILQHKKIYYKGGLEKAAKELVWEHQENTLITIFRNI